MKLLSFENISYYQNHKEILNNISFSIGPGDIQVILGDNNSGRSILALLLSGRAKPTSGVIRYKGKPYKSFSITEAKKNAIEICTTELNLVESMSVEKNLFIGIQNRKLLQFYSNASFHKKINSFLAHYDFKINSNQKVAELDISQKAVVKLLQCIYYKPELLVIDELFSLLSHDDRKKALPILKELRENGCSILYLTQSIEGILGIAGKVRIIRKGEIVFTEDSENLDEINLASILYSQESEDQENSLSNSDFMQYLKYNQAILRDLPVNLLVFDQDHKLRLCNKAASDFLANEELKSNVFKIIKNRGNDIPIVLTALASRKDEILYNIPVEVNNKSFVTNLIFSPVFNNNIYIGKIMIIDDITQQHKLRESITQTEKFSSIGLLTSGVAHEINHPLGIIANTVDYLKSLKTTDKIKFEIESIEDEVKSISYIIGNLKEFASDNITKTDYFDINDLIRKVLQIMRFYCRENNAEIILDAFPSSIFVKLNPTDFKHVLINIIKNSIQAMSASKKIIIKTDLLLSSTEAKTIVTITDNGPGISAEDPNDVFLPFYSTKREIGEGMGLGLYLTYKMVLSMNGNINVKNLPGEGCRFSIELPVSHPPGY